jgi:hypothetical protein
MTAIKIILGCTALASMLSVFAIRSLPVPPPPSKKVETHVSAAWSAEFENAVLKKAEFDVLKKTDRLPLVAASMEPRVIPIERVAPPAPATMPAAIAVEDEPTPVRHRHVVKDEDVCERHHMRKVKSGRYGWRCRR